jgi:hypothetical protein
VIGREVGHVQGVDVASELGAERPREVGARSDLRGGVEVRLQGLEALRLDPGLVHEGRVVVAHAPRVLIGAGPGSRGLLEQPPRAPLSDLEEGDEGAVARAVGRDLRVAQPRAVGELEEVVARPDGAVEAGEVDAVSVGGGRVFAMGARAEHEGQDREKGQKLLLHGRPPGGGRESERTQPARPALYTGCPASSSSSPPW